MSKQAHKQHAELLNFDDSCIWQQYDYGVMLLLSHGIFILDCHPYSLLTMIAIYIFSPEN